MLDVEDLPKLLTSAKSILKSFLLKDNSKLPQIEKQSIEKGGINRLFTYADLEKVIADKNLSHIKLPQKILVLRKPILVKGIITGYQYLSPQEAEKAIDESLKICIHFDQIGAKLRVAFAIHFESEELEEIIFANKESSAGKGFLLKLIVSFEHYAMNHHLILDMIIFFNY